MHLSVAKGVGIIERKVIQPCMHQLRPCNNHNNNNGCVSFSCYTLTATYRRKNHTADETSLKALRLFFLKNKR